MPDYFDKGFSVRKPMWHGKGLVLDAYPDSWAAARPLAGLDWEPTPEPVFTMRLLTYNQVAELNSEAAAGSYVLVDEPKATDRPDRKYRVMIEAEGHQAITRSDTSEVLSVPTGAYSVINHADMGEIIEQVSEVDGAVKFETAGSCRGGRQVWALAYLDEPWQAPGDSSPSYPYLALLNSHDGSAACQLTFTTVRVVCWNTWQAAAAEGERNGTRYVFRHTGSVADKIAAAKEAIAQLRDETKATQALFTQLASTPVDDSQVKTFTELFLPSPRDVGEQCSDRVHGNVTSARASFSKLYTESLTMEGIRGSAYGLLQASTEYLDHVRVHRTSDTLMGRTLLKPDAVKARALTLVHQVAPLAA